jgi:hypothetical protein
MKQTSTKWKDLSGLWIGKLGMPKIPILPKATYRFSAILVKITSVRLENWLKWQSVYLTRARS